MSMRRRTKAWIVVPLVLLMGLGAVAVNAAVRVQVLRPASSICAGAKIKVGVRHRSGGKKKFRIEVRRPSGSLLWIKKGKARRSWSAWYVRLSGTGKYRVVYKIPGPNRAYSVQVSKCVQGGLTDNDGGAAALSLAETGPGEGTASCVIVSYTGTSAISVRLHGVTGGTGLADHMDLTVTRGALPPGTPFRSCDGFVPDEADYLGHGPGVMYLDTLAGFPDDYENGLEDPAVGLAASWVSGSTHAYRFEVDVHDDNAAQGLSATQEFVWEGRG